MTFKEKSRKKTSGKSVDTGAYTFTDVVDKACDELMERQIKYSIRRIQEMDDCLSRLEHELDEFLKEKK